MRAHLLVARQQHPDRVIGDQAPIPDQFQRGDQDRDAALHVVRAGPLDTAVLDPKRLLHQRTRRMHRVQVAENQQTPVFNRAGEIGENMLAVPGHFQFPHAQGADGLEIRRYQPGYPANSRFIPARRLRLHIPLQPRDRPCDPFFRTAQKLLDRGHANFRHLRPSRSTRPWFSRCSRYAWTVAPVHRRSSSGNSVPYTSATMLPTSFGPSPSDCRT